MNDIYLSVENATGDFSLEIPEYIETDSTLTKPYMAANAKATGDALNFKVNRPLAGGLPTNGTNGQVLMTNGDGSTAWTDKATSAEIQQAVTNWLDDNVDPVGAAVVVDSSLSISGAAADAKVAGDNINALTDVTDYTSVVSTGTWAFGQVTSSGIDTNKKNVHSGLFSIGDNDYIDIQLTNTNRAYWFTIYTFNGTSYYPIQPIGALWIKEGGYRLTDKTVQYIVRMRNSGNTTMTDAELADAPNKVEVSAGIYNKNNQTFSPPKALVSVSTSGYADAYTNATTLPFDIGNGFDSIYFDASNTGAMFEYAVYTYDGSSFGAKDAGWHRNDLEYTDKTVQYILRIRKQGGTSLTQEEFVTASNAIKMYRKIKYPVFKSYGYSRNYTDITHELTFERKAISSNGIEDSTTSLLAKIPNYGNFECRLNTPLGKFAVWEKSGTTYTCLKDWTYYQYRYTGDYSSEYYVAVALPNNATINTDSIKIVSVLQYSDEGVCQELNTGLSGKNIAVFGDSIVQGRFPKNGLSVNGVMPKPWPNLLSEIAGTEPNNFGIGGALVYDNDWRSLSEHYTSVTGFDIVFICAGTNDFGNDITMNDFEAAFSTIITSLVSTNTEVIVCTPTRRSSDDANNIGLYLQDYADIEKTVAETNELKVIDLYTLTNNSLFKAYIPDGLHPDETGHKLIADLILDNIIQ